MSSARDHIARVELDPVRQPLDLLGREPYLTVLKNGTVFITGHLLAQDVRNKWGYTTGFLHRSTDGGRTWQSTRVESEQLKPKASNHTTRNVLELTDGSLLLDRLLEALDQKHEVDGAARLVARYIRLGLPSKPLINQLTFAVMREDLDFHALQVLEAGVRQIELWPKGSIQVEHILVGVTRYVAAQCPTQRAGLQTARIALRLHRGDAIYEDDEDAS